MHELQQLVADFSEKTESKLSLPDPVPRPARRPASSPKRYSV